VASNCDFSSSINWLAWRMESWTGERTPKRRVSSLASWTPALEAIARIARTWASLAGRG
jgi:hypothetical protein